MTQFRSQIETITCQFPTDISLFTGEHSSNVAFDED